MKGELSVALALEDSAFRYVGGPNIGPITFAAHPGEVWAILGANGAGKSTLLKILAGELRPHQGHATASGAVELVPQSVSIPGRLAAGQVLSYLALLKGVPSVIRRERVRSALMLVNLTDHEHAPVRTLSGGQHRRLVIAQALLTRPRAVLLDEPSAGLDLDQRATLRGLVTRLGIDHAVLISSHIVEDLAGVASHVLHLVSGEMVFCGLATDYLRVTDSGATDTGSGGTDGVDRWVSAYHVWNRERDHRP